MPSSFFLFSTPGFGTAAGTGGAAGLAATGLARFFGATARLLVATGLAPLALGPFLAAFTRAGRPPPLAPLPFGLGIYLLLLFLTNPSLHPSSSFPDTPARPQVRASGYPTCTGRFRLCRRTAAEDAIHAPACPVCSTSPYRLSPGRYVWGGTDTAWFSPRCPGSTPYSLPMVCLHTTGSCRASRLGAPPALYNCGPESCGCSTRSYIRH